MYIFRKASKFLAVAMVAVMVLAMPGMTAIVQAATPVVAQWVGASREILPVTSTLYFTHLQDVGGTSIARVGAGWNAVLATSQNQVDWTIVAPNVNTDMYLDGRFFWIEWIDGRSRLVSAYADDLLGTRYETLLGFEDGEVALLTLTLRDGTLSVSFSYTNDSHWTPGGFAMSTDGDNWSIFHAADMPPNIDLWNMFVLPDGRLFAPALRGDWPYLTTHVYFLDDVNKPTAWRYEPGLTLAGSLSFAVQGGTLQAEGWDGNDMAYFQTTNMQSWHRALPAARFYRVFSDVTHTLPIQRPIRDLWTLPYTTTFTDAWGSWEGFTWHASKRGADGNRVRLNIYQDGNRINPPLGVPSPIEGLSPSQWERPAIEFIMGNGFMGLTEGVWEAQLAHHSLRGEFMGGLMQVFDIQAPATPVPGFTPFTDLQSIRWWPYNMHWLFTGHRTDYTQNLLDVAGAHGFTQGVAPGQFNPRGSITRQEAFTMMYRVLLDMGLVTPAPVSHLDAFGDREMVANWAAEAIASLVAAGIVAGMDGDIQPHGNLTRAQMFTLLMRVSDMQ
jgi:hypothetical protein